MNGEAIKRKYERLEARVSLWGNTVLGILKVAVGLYTGLLVLIADGIHSFVDMSSSVVVYISSLFADKPPDLDHPYGHGKALALGEVIMALLLMLTSLELVLYSVKLMMGGSEYYTNMGLALVIVFISVLLKELMARFAFYLYSKTGSNLIRLDGLHHRMDMYSSLIALVGVVGVWLGVKYLDALLAALIGLSMFWMSIVSMKTPVNVLMDMNDLELSKKIKEEAEGVCEDGLRVEDVITRDYGSIYVIELHLNYDDNIRGSRFSEAFQKLSFLLRSHLNKDFKLNLVLIPKVKGYPLELQEDDMKRQEVG